MTLQKELKILKKKEALVSQLEAIKISLSEKLILLGKENIDLTNSLARVFYNLHESVCKTLEENNYQT